jgi:uncharacterized protein YbcC (UPF0753/DUF2309 family)
MNMTTAKLNAIIAEKAKHLPNIRPLREFLHLNLFPGLQPLPFWKAMEQCSVDFGQIPFPSLSFYKSKLKEREIDHDILNSQVKHYQNHIESSEYFIRQTEELNGKVYTHEKSQQPIHQLIAQQIGHSINEIVEPQLTRWLSAFMDQGISFWKMPGNEDTSLYQTIIQLLKNSFFPLHPFRKDLINHLSTLSPHDAINYALEKILADETLSSFYIEEVLFSLKGWAGFINTIEKNPNLLSEQRRVSLEEFIALKVILEWAWIKKLCPKYIPIGTILHGKQIQKSKPLSKNLFVTYKTWHESLERTYYQNILKEIKAFRPSTALATPLVQFLFCIDDRECSLRRILENANDHYETFGTPGHFGMDFIYQQSPTDYPKKHCPAPIQPQFLLYEEGTVDELKHKSLLDWLKLSKMNTLTTILYIFFNGFRLVYSMLKNIFLPIDVKTDPVRETNLKSKLHLIRNNDIKNNFNLFHGYTHEELAKRVNDVLVTIGLVKNFSPLVLTLGHGAKTTNNPYFTAYGCGACSGRAGIPNSRAFCQAANDPLIRKILSTEYQINIPDTTYFLSAYHDTCQDSINIFNPENIPDGLGAIYKKMKSDLNFALKKNAQLRCQSFELVPKNTLDKLAIAEAHRRSEAIFEPRPELGHTNNALCVVGKRSSFKGISFERRAFLQSYDYTLDPEGLWLNSILSAAIPVCGGINLDYFFARINNLGFGAGSKLSQSVVGLFAVTNGVEDDLLIGLPNQMIELHTPIRIMFVIEQYPEIVKSVLSKNQNLNQWINNEWSRLATIDPVTREIYFFDEGDFKHCPEGKIC